MSDKYGPRVGVRIPQDNLDLIDQLVDDQKYNTRSDFIRKSVRTRLQQHQLIPGDQNYEQIKIEQIFPQPRLEYIQKIISHPFVQMYEGHTDINDFIRYAVNHFIEDYGRDVERINTHAFIFKEIGIVGFLKYLIIHNTQRDGIGISINDIKIFESIDNMAILKIQMPDDHEDTFDEILNEKEFEKILGTEKMDQLKQLNKMQFIKKFKAGEI